MKFKTHLLCSGLMLMLLTLLTGCFSTEKTRDPIPGVPDNFEVEYFSNDLNRGRTRYVTYKNDGMIYFLGGQAAKQQSLSSGSNRRFDTKDARNKRKLTNYEVKKLYDFVMKHGFLEAKGELFPEARRLYKVSLSVGDQSKSFDSGNDRVPHMEELGDIMTKMALRHKYDGILDQIDVRKKEIENQREFEKNQGQ